MFITHLSSRAIFTESEMPDKTGFVHIVTTAWEGVMVTEIDTHLYDSKDGQYTREVIRHPHSNWPRIAFRMHHEHVKATRQELLHAETLPYRKHVAQGLVEQARAAWQTSLCRARWAFKTRPY